MQVTHLVQDYVLPAGHNCFFVTNNGDVIGIITLDNIRAVSRNLPQALTTRQVMTPINSPFLAGPDEDMMGLLQRMDDENVSQVPVVENGNLLGVVTRQNLLEYLRRRKDLGAAVAS